MEMSGIPFGTTDWSSVERTEHRGETGMAYWRTRHFGAIRVRLVEYTPGYLADHWCSKGHIVLCIEGDLTAEHQGGPQLVITAGMSYLVANDAEAYRWSTVHGAKVFIVD